MIQYLYEILILLLIISIVFYIAHRRGIISHSVDRYMSSHPIITLGAAILIIVFVMLILIAIGDHFAGVENDNKLIEAFIQNQLPENAKPYSYHLIVSLLGAFLFSGFLVALFTNVALRRNKRYSEGASRYMLRNHIIILGCNSLLPGIIKSICRDIRAENLDVKRNYLATGFFGYLKYYIYKIRQLGANRIVIVTSIRKSKVFLAIDEGELGNSVIIYNQDLNHIDVFNSLNINNAKEIVIIGDDEPKFTDFANVDLARKVTALKTNSNYRCHISVYDERILYSGIDVGPDNKIESANNITLRPMNYLKMCLCNIWGYGRLNKIYNPQDIQNDDDAWLLLPLKEGKKEFNILILGFNDLVKTMIRTIATTAHYRDNVVTNVTVATNNDAKFKMFIDAIYDNIDDIRFTRVDESIDNLDKDHISNIDYLAICTSDAEKDNLYLKYACYRHPNIPILCYAESKKQIYKKISQLYYGVAVNYWGCYDDAAFMSTFRDLNFHALRLYNACHKLTVRDDSFDKLHFAARDAWLDFVNFLPTLLDDYMIRLSNPKPDCDCNDNNRKILADTRVSLNKYHDAAAKMHPHTTDNHGKSTYDVLYMEQLNIICDNYEEMLCTYFNNYGRPMALSRTI